MMTFEELKVEADLLGYNLIPKPVSIKMFPCFCGNNRRTKWWVKDGVYYECQRCGNASPIGASENEAKKLWNAMIEKGKV